jgi:hypothetical protein
LPKHTSSVALVIDLETAHVFPQFHLKFYNLFETMSPTRVNPQARNLSWQKLCHFGKDTSEKGKGPSRSGTDTGTKELVMDVEQALFPKLMLLEDPVLFPEGPARG